MKPLEDVQSELVSPFVEVARSAGPFLRQLYSVGVILCLFFCMLGRFVRPFGHRIYFERHVNLFGRIAIAHLGHCLHEDTQHEERRKVFFDNEMELEIGTWDAHFMYDTQDLLLLGSLCFGSRQIPSFLPNLDRLSHHG
jgi:hypothetical protein